MRRTAGVAVDEQFVHSALFYRGRQEYLAGTVPFIEDGLRADEPVAVVVPGPNLALLRRELGQAAGRVRMQDMAEAGRNPARIIPGVLRAFADQHPATRSRIVGEPIWAARTSIEYPASAQHEALINLAFVGRPATIRCPYDAEALDARVLADAEVTHPVLVDAQGQRPSSAYAPEEIVARYNRPLTSPREAEELTLRATNVRQARDFASARARRLGLDPKRLTDFELVVTELVSNTVRHGGALGTLRIWADERHVVCEVRDSGRILDPLAGRRPAHTRRVGGRGLLVVHHLCDLSRVHTGETGTTFQVYFCLT